jgi:hypothetical protein
MHVGGRQNTSGISPPHNSSLIYLRDHGAEKGTVMAAGVGLLKELCRRDCSSDPRLPKCSWLGGIAAAVLAVSLLLGLPADADEFDALAVYSEARPLNERWQACAASYVRRRLQSQVSSEVLASSALRSCRVQESRLRRFFISRIGRRSAENVVAVLYLRYRADLAAAIDELRTRD